MELYLYSGNKLRGGVAHVFLFRDKRLHPLLQKLKTLSKIWGGTSRLASKHWTNFLLSLFGRELGKCTVWERAFFLLGQSQKYSSPWVPKEKICTYWQVWGPDGKYLARNHDVQTERSDVPNMTECKIFSCLARTNSVNKHLIIWPLNAENFENFVST